MSGYGSSQYGQSTYGPGHPYANVSGKVMWMVQVDWDRDGVFDDDCEPQTITKMKFKAGRRSRIKSDGSGQESTKLETFWVEILDTGGRYDGFNAGSPIYNYLGAMGMLVRILAVSTTGRGAAEPIFTGVLTNLNYDQRSQRATLSGEGMARWLMDVPVWTECQPWLPGYTWDSYFHDDGSTPFPVNYWKGRPNGVTLRECVRLTLAEAAYPFGGYYGAAVVNGEQPDFFYFDGSSAWSTLEELADGFAARMFVLRDGRIFAMDRLDVTGMNAGEAAPTRAQTSFGVERPNAWENLRNTVKVNVRPHAVQPFKIPYLAEYYREVWSNSGPVAVGPGETVEMDVRYNAEAPSEGSFIDVNSSGYPVNFECWSAADKTGTRMDSAGTGDGEFTIIYEVINGSTYPYGNNQQWTRVKYINHSGGLTAYFFNTKVMLIGIRETGAALTKQVVDAGSVALNGTRALNINSRWVQTANMGAAIAQAYADALSSRVRATPATLLYQWSGELLYQNLLTYDLGTHVQFGAAGGSASLDNFGMSGRWLVVGREMEWMSADGQDARVKLTFEKAADDLIPAVLERVSSASGTAVSSVTVSHQVDEQPGRLLVVLVSLRALQSVSSITYGGVALTKWAEAQYSTGNNPRVEMWYLAGPAVGTANVIVGLSGAEFVEVGVVGFHNANQGVPVGPAKTGSGGAAPASLFPVAGAAGDIFLDGLGYAGADATPGASQTLVAGLTSDGTWKLGASQRAGATVVTMSWTTPGAWAQVAAAVKAASG